MLKKTAIALLAAASTLGALSESAAQTRRPAALGDSAEVIDAALSVSRSIELGAISMAEVLGMASSGPRSAASAPSATGAGGSYGLGVWTPGSRPMLHGMTEASEVRRTVTDAWQLRVDSAGRRQHHFDVAYAVRDGNGHTGRLSHPSHADSAMRIRLEPLLPTVIATDGEFDVLQGGVTFYMDLSDVTSSGTHRGTLTVTFNSF